MKKNLIQKTFATTLAIAFAASMTVGCGQTASKDAAGTLLLSVNPEIEIEYDDKGLVIELEGINDDGKSILKDEETYVGKECNEVVKSLVKKIYDNGYFETEFRGNEKNIVIKLEDGSAYPDDDFLEEIAESVRTAVGDCGLSSAPMVVEQDDLDDQGRIDIEKARELALAQFGFTAAEFDEYEYDLDDNIYEFEFTVDGVEYECEVNAVSGKVTEAHTETNDDWDDVNADDDDDDIDDTDDDDNDDIDDDDNDDIDDNDDDDNDDIDDDDDDDDNDDIDDNDDDDIDDNKDDDTDDIDDNKDDIDDNDDDNDTDDDNDDDNDTDDDNDDDTDDDNDDDNN